jgi:hypothetical protein
MEDKPNMSIFHLPVLLQFLNNLCKFNMAYRATGHNKRRSVSLLALFLSNSPEDKRK